MKSTSNLKQLVQTFIRRYRLDVFKDVALFILITLVIHYTYRYWANTLEYWPLKEAIFNLEGKMAETVYYPSAWFVGNVLQIEITAVDQNKTMYFANEGYIAVNRSCSGFKQILQFVLLMLLFPGSWKRKLWFIPLGVIAVYFTNLFRIIGLSVVIVVLPEYWDFSHDYLFRPFFYVVIFMLWVWWVEKLAKPKTEKAIAG
ncbi:MAG: archaeosortase/exosortase family protein [Bacteroidales bacterium]|nr:archaeosortase/exosortase family protein [Bacteroidales bacterium]